MWSSRVGLPDGGEHGAPVVPWIDRRQGRRWVSVARHLLNVVIAVDAGVVISRLVTGPAVLDILGHRVSFRSVEKPFLWLIGLVVARIGIALWDERRPSIRVGPHPARRSATVASAIGERGRLEFSFPTRRKAVAAIVLCVGLSLGIVFGAGVLVCRYMDPPQDLRDCFGVSERDAIQTVLGNEGLQLVVQSAVRTIPPGAAVRLETDQRPYVLNYYLYPRRLYMSPERQIELDMIATRLKGCEPGSFARQPPQSERVAGRCADVRHLGCAGRADDVTPRQDQTAWMLRYFPAESQAVQRVRIETISTVGKGNSVSDTNVLSRECGGSGLTRSSSVRAAEGGRRATACGRTDRPAGKLAKILRLPLSAVAYHAALMLIGMGIFRWMVPPGCGGLEDRRLMALSASLGIGMAVTVALALLVAVCTRRFSLDIVWAVVPAALLSLCWRRSTPAVPVLSMTAVSKRWTLMEVSLLAFLSATLVTILVWAVICPLEGVDSRAIYATTAKILYYERTVCGESIQDPNRIHYHRNYPLLLPYWEASLFNAVGCLSERVAKAASPLCLTALAGLFYSFVRRRLSRTLALAMTAALVMPPFVGFYRHGGAVSGYADVPLAYFWGGGVMFMCLYMEGRGTGCLAAAACMHAAAVMTKNEGIMLVGLAAIGLAVADLSMYVRRTGEARSSLLSASRGLLLYLAVVCVLSLPWLLVRHTLPASILDEDYVARLHQSNPWQLVRQVPLALWHIVTLGTRHWYERWNLVWLVFLIVPLVAGSVAKHRATAFVGVLMAVQTVAYGLVYLLSPHDLGWHIRVSWDRLLIHVLPLAALWCASHAGPLCDSMECRYLDNREP